MPASSAPPFLLAKRRDDGVSERGPATIRRISTSDPRPGSAATDIPVSPSSHLPGVNAPARGRLSTTSYTSQSSRQSASSHLSSDAEPPPSSITSTAASGARRPQSRARNFVAVLNEDKTFSLVPQRPRNTDAQSQNPPASSSSGLSDYGGSGGRSSQLPFPITPRVSQASSHEGYSSYASSHYDRPSSSLAGTIPDRSITPSTPVPSSPGSSTQETITEHPIAESSASPWNFRMFGGLRRVPNLPAPDTKGKHPAHSPGSDTAETPPPHVPEDTSSLDDNLVHSRSSDQEEQASIHSSVRSADSDAANYRVFSGSSEAPPHPEPQEQERVQERGSDESLVDPHLRPQSSFATVDTTSTEFESSNYKIYTHSDDEGSVGARSESPVEGPSSPAKRNLYVPQLEPQASIGSIQSGVSSASENTNYKVYGSPSPNLSPVPESEPLREERELRPAQSFLSTTSTTYETDNYKVYGGRISPAAFSSVESFSPPSPSGSYAPLLRSPTGLAPSLYTQEEEAGPSTIANVDPNYVVHGEPSPESSREASREPSRQNTPNSTGSGETIVRREPREEESQDILAISPLRPSKGFEEGFGYYTRRSRSRSGSKSKDDLKSKKSLKSVKSSISSAINEEEADNFYAAQAYLDAPPGEYEPVPGPSERQRQLDEQRERERQQREAAAWEAAGASGGPQGGPMALPTTPHQWSSQLSTVMSESEPDSSSSGNRASMISASPQGSHGSHERRSSRGWSSSHSRQMLSISSSLAAELEANSRSRSDSHPGSLERPGPAYRGFHGAVRDHDEDGDGLGDLHQISPRPSRSRLSDMFTSSSSSDRSLHTSASNRSFNNGIPLWAKLYYGSGERRFLRSHSISSMSDLSSRPGSGIPQSASPLSENYPLGIYSPRRRARESTHAEMAHRRSTTGSMDIQPIPAVDDQELGFRRSLRRMTSSLWSPHLRRDVRAQNRYSIWDTPSVAWSAESGVFGRRNVQVVFFVMGFIFPFAWMIGAVLPLPKPSPLAMVQRDSSYSDLAVRQQSHEYERHIESVDELRYENARWWRMLNRIMSVVGLLIIAAVVTLVVLALRDGWGTRTG